MDVSRRGVHGRRAADSLDAASSAAAHWRMTMDDCPKELSDMKRHDLPSDNEWELEVRRVLLAKIERLQRELDIAKHLALKESKMNRELHLQMHACGGALSKAQGDLLRAERERDEALAAIRNAPHGMGCHSLQAEFQHTAGWASLEYCDCWKRAILDAAREVE